MHYEKLKELFFQANGCHFEDGYSNEFTHRLGAYFHNDDAAIAFFGAFIQGQRNTDAVHYGLRELGEATESNTRDMRLSVLLCYIDHPNPYINDGARLGIASLDDPRALPYFENIYSKKQDKLVLQVIEQLKKTKADLEDKAKLAQERVDKAINEIMLELEVAREQNYNIKAELGKWQ